MELHRYCRMAFVQWSFLAWFVFFSVGLETLAKSCDQHDLLGLKEFAGNLTKGSIITAWSDSVFCCKWVGVVCEDVVDGGSRVSKLVLPGMGLNGTISSSLASLDQLKVLDISFNHLQGGLPSEFSNLKQLEVLDLSHNILSGPLVGTLADLQSLQILNISSNLFVGDLFQFGGLQHLVALNISNNSLTALEQLSVSMNNLSGQLSMKLSNLSNLKSLIISGNRFSGELPNVFGNLSDLEQLIAHSNSFSGSLPSTLALCSKLQVLDLRNNSLTGSVGLNFTGLSNLSTLDLGSNHFNGPLPNSLFNCHELTMLSLAKNELTGQIPESYANLTSLLTLSLSNNSFENLSGALYVLQHCKNLTTLILTKNFRGEEISENLTVSFKSLVVLALGNCGLKGRIPVWLLNCSKLEVLDLSWNHLEGSVPSWIGWMDHLFYLDLSNNSLTGEIPKGLTELKGLISLNYHISSLFASAAIPLYVKRNKSANGLQYNHASSFPPSIYLSNNRLSGTIWPEIGRLRELHILDLSRNNITGTIPSSISEMKNLETLDLSNNNLYGTIPPSFNNLTFLSKFSVAYNHLWGTIPAGGQFSSFPNSSFEGNLGLCGETYNHCNNEKNVDISTPSSGKFGKSSVLGITIGCGVGLALLIAVILLRMSKKDEDKPVDNFDEELSWPNRVPEAVVSSKLVLFQNSDCKDLTVEDLIKSTNNFNQENIIGCGGFGLVYKANLQNGRKVAVKKLSGYCGQVEREFQAEVEALSRAQHKNLVSLKGYCQHLNDRLLIYSYLENGSLDYWLHESEDGNSALKWNVRLKVAQGAAHGLAYLHKECEPHIVHRDIKSSNILLDDKFEAYLADFGLSRLLQPYDTHVSTDLVGTLGYIPPEYSQALKATFKGDIYSFGVVLVELLTGRRPVEVIVGQCSRNLVSWVFQMKSENRDQEIFDSVIWHKDIEKQLLEVLDIACKCIDADPRQRPHIELVVSWLDGVGFDGSE
ncbi:phytosulfokine receptor 2 isoform X2 [Vigna angularis]|uniref:phytosulfokine receptor 2 isoform X2 n=1 Tax=Phaseolus angularis TaxID=3914 RepID=UPI000809C7C4|nr:phytosulfokine receptor 2 isoform X2 [Vigna angularis]